MTQIHWLKAVDGAFTTAADWSTGSVPGSADDAILDAPGSAAYTVTAAGNITVDSFQTAANATLAITGSFTALNGTGTGVSAGLVNVMNGATLTLQGVVVIPNLLTVIGSTLPTTVVIGAGGVTLEGPFSFSAGNSLGSLILNFEGANQQIVGATDTSTLDIVNARLSGQGQLGEGKLIINVEAQGFIEAKGLGTLVINTGAHTITNAGLIDAEGEPSSSLTPIEGLIESPVQNTGILEADGRGASLVVEDAVTGAGGRGVITGGVLEFDSTFNQSVTFAFNHGQDNGELVLAHAQGFTSPVIGFSPTGGQTLDFRDIGFVSATEVSFSGTSSSGVLTVSDGTHATRFVLSGGDYSGSTFVAAADGHGGVQITTATPVHWLSAVAGDFATPSDWSAGATPGPIDEAILDAPGNTAYTVTVSTAQSVAVIETAAGATLDVAAAFADTNGTGAGANAGAIEVGPAVLTLGGQFANSGAVNLSGSSSGAAYLTVAGPGATLSGGGVVALGGDLVHDTISGAGAVLTNADNTIEGGGQLSGVALVNQAAGVIDANTAAVLAISTGARTVANAGTIEATGSGRLFLEGAVIDDSAGGRIIAAGGQVQLQGTRITGGTLASAGAGIVWAEGAGNVVDGRAGKPVTLAGDVRVADGGALTAEGAVVNTDFLYVGGPSTAAQLIVAGGVTLSGGGHVAFGDGAGNEIVAATTATFTNVDNLITAAGFIGGSGLTLVNKAAGVINGWSSATGLVIDTGANAIANAGTLESTGSGQVVVKSAVANSGLIFAAGGMLTLDGAVTGTGAGHIKAGVLNIAARFGEAVTFISGATGQLRLTDFTHFTGTVKGLSFTGANSIDLAGFTLKGAKATYSGTTASGVLTVTNGTQTATIHLIGNYTGSKFALTTDGHGGTVVKDPAASSAPTAAMRSTHALVAGMAGFGAGAAGTASVTHEPPRVTPSSLARPLA